MLGTVVVLSVLSLSPRPDYEARDGCTGLQHAVLDGDLARVRKLGGARLLGLAKQARVDEPGTSGGGAGSVCTRRTAVMVAAEHGRLEAVRTLFHGGASLHSAVQLEVYGDLPMTPACLALANRHQETFELLEELGAMTAPCIDNARLLGAVASPRWENLQDAMRGNPTPAAVVQALVRVIGQKQAEKVGLLLRLPGFDALEAHSPPGARLTAGEISEHADFSPVWTAVLALGDTQAGLWLVQYGVRARAEHLALALSLDRLTLIPVLVEAGANRADHRVTEAVRLAVVSSRADAVWALLATGWRGNADLPLLLQAMRHTPSLVEWMIEHGVDVNLRDPLGVTPLSYARERGRDDWVRLLLARGAEEWFAPGERTHDPELIHEIQARYPPAARHAGLEGVVELELKVDKTGRVTDVQVISSPGLTFSQAAVSAAKRFLYNPAVKDGQPVATTVLYQSIFELDDPPY